MDSNARMALELEVCLRPAAVAAHDTVVFASSTAGISNGALGHMLSACASRSRAARVPMRSSPKFLDPCSYGLGT